MDEKVKKIKRHIERKLGIPPERQEHIMKWSDEIQEEEDMNTHGEFIEAVWDNDGFSEAEKCFCLGMSSFQFGLRAGVEKTIKKVLRGAMGGGDTDSGPTPSDII